ncbi:MAG: FG-GAP-like repeat-containing protein [Terriglobales bacterium]|jgi:hypothetical protein
MTRKFSRNYSLSAVVPFIAILTLLIAVAVLAQTSGSGQTSGKANAVLAPAGTPASAQAQRPLTPWTDGAERSPGGGSQTKRRGARPLDVPLFLPVVTYDSAGTYPLSVAVADVNGDGKPDLLVANSGSATVGVLLGNGDGTFQPAVTYGTGGSGAGGVAVADVNGDGKPDIVVTSGPSSVSVLLGNGDGTFEPAVAYNSGGNGAGALAVGDVNGDGKPDLVVANGSSYSVGVLLGNGDGTFQPASSYDVTGNPVSVAIADVNGDHKPDVVEADDYYQDLAGVLLGNGDGTFQPVVEYLVGEWYENSIAVADLNGDGHPDLIVSAWGQSINNQTGQVVVLLGNGDGTFQPAVAYNSGEHGGTSAAVADVNGDGKPDLVTSNAGSGFGVVGVLLGNGDGAFQAAEDYPSGGNGYPESVVLADVNGDGLPDVVLVNYYDNDVAVLLNNTGPHGSTTTTLAALPNPSVYGQAVTFTAAVSAASGTPAGTVIFYNGSTQLGSATLASGSASFSYSLLAAGSYPITAAYQGSTSFSPSTSAPLNQVVNTAMTTTSLVSSQNPALVKDTVFYTATVAGQYGGAVTGTIVFQDGGSTVATVPMVGNQAAYSTSYSSPGTHSMTATYSGDTNNARSVSATLVEQIIKGGFASETVLTTSGSPSPGGQPVTFTATVTSARGTIPDGELVTFYDGITQLGSVPLASETAAYTTLSLSVGTHVIKATYAGDATFKSSSGTVKQVIDKYPTTTSVSLYPNPGDFEYPVYFTATVTSSGPTPAGEVKFMDGTRQIGSAKVDPYGNGYLTKKLTAGTHLITVQYVGDSIFAGSTSPVWDEYVYGK